MHNTLTASEYALLDHDTHDPRPNYWVALFWSRLMGTAVYDAGEIAPGVDIFTHSLKASSKGMALMIINTLDSACKVNVPNRAEQFMITAEDLQSEKVRLNGTELALTENGELPPVDGRKIKAGDVILPPHSILFLAFTRI